MKAFNQINLIAISICLLLLSCVSSPETTKSPDNSQNAQKIEKKDDIYSLIEAGDVSAIKNKLNAKELANGKNDKGEYPLHIAIKTGSLEIVTYLIEDSGANINVIDANGKTGIFLACESGFKDIARYLAQKEANPFLSDANGVSAVDLALAKGFINLIISSKTVNTRSDKMPPLLHRVVESYPLETVESILALNPDINLKDNSGRTALDIAFMHPDKAESISIAEALINRGAVTQFSDFNYLVRAVKARDYSTLRSDDGSTALHEATRKGHIGVVEFLLTKKVPINPKNASGSTPLLESVRLGNVSLTELLLKKGADVKARDNLENSCLHIETPEVTRNELYALLIKNGADSNLKDRGGNTPLHIAASLGLSNETALILLNAGSDPNAANADGDTPLMVAVQKEKPILARLLVQKGASIFSQNARRENPLTQAFVKGITMTGELITSETVNSRDDTLATPIILAIQTNESIDILNLILERGADINAQNTLGDTALHLAVRKDLRKQGELLLAKGADIFRTNKNGELALTLALKNPLKPIDWLFTSATMVERDSQGDTILHYIARLGLKDMVGVVLLRGADINARNANGETAIFQCIKSDSDEVVKILKQAGASLTNRDVLGNTAIIASVLWNAKKSILALDPSAEELNAANLSGKTALHEAIRKGNSYMITYIISKKANIDARDNQGLTPLHEALKAKRIDIMQTLTSSGADVEERDDSGSTCLLEAVRTKNKEACELLISKGAYIHAKDARSDTPFISALMQGKETLSLIITSETVSMRSEDGKTPLHVLCAAKPAKELIQFLILSGAKVNVRDANANTPLHELLITEAYESAKVLVGENADLFTRNKDQDSCASILIKKGSEALSKVLSTKSLEKTDNQGNTLLHIAVLSKDSAVVKELLVLGANTKKLNFQGESAYDLAIKVGAKDIQDLVK